MLTKLGEHFVDCSKTVIRQGPQLVRYERPILKGKGLLSLHLGQSTKTPPMSFLMVW